MSESTRPSKIAYTAFDPLKETFPAYVLVGQRPAKKHTSQSTIGQIVQNSQYNIRLTQMQYRGATHIVDSSSLSIGQDDISTLRDDLDRVIAWMAEPFPEEFDELLIPEVDERDDSLIPGEDDYDVLPKLKSVYTEDQIKRLLTEALRQFNIPDLDPVVVTLFLKLKDADALSMVGD